MPPHKQQLPAPPPPPPRPPGDTVHSQEMRNLRPELKAQSALEKPQGFPQELPREHPPPGGEKDTPNWPLPPLSPPPLTCKPKNPWHGTRP